MSILVDESDDDIRAWWLRCLHLCWRMMMHIVVIVITTIIPNKIAPETPEQKVHTYEWTLETSVFSHVS